MGRVRARRGRTQRPARRRLRPELPGRLRSPLAWRSATTALGTYGAALFGFLGTVAAARQLDLVDYGLLALVLAATGFLQLFLDLTVEEAVVKFGFRYTVSEDWARLRQLFRIGLAVKLGGGIAGGLGLLILAPFSEALWGHDIAVPLVIAAALPVVQAPEGIASAALFIGSRYDLRGLYLAFAMALRLVALAVGSHFGVTEAIAAVVVAQAVSTTAIVVLARTVLRQYPSAPSAPIGDDRSELRRFIVQSSVGSGLVSLRGTLGTVLLGVVSTPAQVGYYRNALAPQAGFAALSAPVRMILLSEQTKDFEEGRRDRLFGVLKTYILGTTGLMALALPPLLWFMPDLVTLVYGDRYAPAGDPARLILLAAALQLIWGWTKSFPVSIGRPALRIIAHGAEIAVLIPLTLVLGARWGAEGAATAVLL